MSYLTENSIANSPSMQARVAQAAAGEGLASLTDPVTNGPYDPDRWASTNRRYWAAAPGWAEAWDSAMVSHPDDGDPVTPPYDPGTDPGVITDGMILSQVQAMLNPPPPVPLP